MAGAPQARAGDVALGCLVTVTLLLAACPAAARTTPRSTPARGAQSGPGFLDYLYFTNFETIDPRLYDAPAGCVGRYHSEWAGSYECEAIDFVGGDTLEGPMHTNDATRVEGAASFGRAGEQPPDVVEIDGGTYPEDGGGQCGGEPVFHTATGCYAEGARITLPEGDTGLAVPAQGGVELSGETRLELNGTAGTIAVVSFGEDGRRSARTIAWPGNGLIYVRSQACGWPTAGSTQEFNADGAAEAESEKGCGNVYVRGSYSRPLTIAAEDDVIIDGDLYPTSVAGNLGAAPGGTATLGLVAGNFVRIYHPVAAGHTNTLAGCSGSNLGEAEDPNGWGSQPNIWVYAAILAADHTFLLDNFLCGAQLGAVHIYGSIAQNYRGVIGTASASGGSGYVRDYKYDDRLASDAPPYFPQPVSGPCPLSEAGAALIGAGGERRAPFTVRISSLGISQITFYLDGHALHTLDAAQAPAGQFAVRVNPRALAYGAHTLSVSTVMVQPACPSIALSSVFVRPRPRLVVPSFTG